MLQTITFILKRNILSISEDMINNLVYVNIEKKLAKRRISKNYFKLTP